MLLAACSFEDDLDPGTFSGPVLQRTAVSRSMIARAFAHPVAGQRALAYSEEGSVVRFWRGASVCPIGDQSYY
jgi:hypothetical protein